MTRFDIYNEVLGNSYVQMKKIDHKIDGCDGGI